MLKLINNFSVLHMLSVSQGIIFNPYVQFQALVTSLQKNASKEIYYHVMGRI